MSKPDVAALYGSVVIEIANDRARAAARVSALVHILPAYGLTAAAEPVGGPGGRMTDSGGIRYLRVDGPAASLALLRGGELEALLAQMDAAVKTASVAFNRTLAARGVRAQDRPRFRRTFRENFALAWGVRFAERAWSAAAGDLAPHRRRAPDFYGDQVHASDAVDALDPAVFDGVAVLRRAAATAEAEFLAAHGAAPLPVDTPDDYCRPQPAQVYVEASAPRPMRENRWHTRFVIRAHRADVRYRLLAPIIETIGAERRGGTNPVGQYVGHATGARDVVAVLHRHLDAWVAQGEAMAHAAVRDHLIPHLAPTAAEDLTRVLSAWRCRYLIAYGQAMAERIAAALARRPDAACSACPQERPPVLDAAEATARADVDRLPAADFTAWSAELGAEAPRDAEPLLLLESGGEVTEYYGRTWVPGRPGFATQTVRIAIGPAGLLSADRRAAVVLALAEAFGIATCTTGCLEEGRTLLDRREVLDLAAPGPVLDAVLAAMPGVLAFAEDAVVGSIAACEGRLARSELSRRAPDHRAMWRRFWANDVFRALAPAFRDRLAATVVGHTPPGIPLWTAAEDGQDDGLSGDDVGQFAVLGMPFEVVDALAADCRSAWNHAEALPTAPGVKDDAEDAPRPRVIIVACGAKKAAGPTTAGSMYVGRYHKAARRAADALTAEEGTVYILSARYGLLRLDDVIEPYDQRAGAPGAIGVADLARQAEALGISGAEVTALTPAAYTAMIRKVWPEATATLAGTRSIGEQMSRLAAIAKTASPPRRPARPAASKPSATQRRRARNASKPRLHLRPLRFRQACALVAEHHRHHRAPQGHLFSIGAADDHGRDVGAVIVGRPVARHYDDGLTAEVTWLVVVDQAPNASSHLLGAAWRAARAMGYRRMLTYTQAEESGASLRAAGWRQVAVRPARAEGWDTPSRPRQPTGTEGVARVLWEITCGPDINDPANPADPPTPAQAAEETRVSSASV